MAKHIREGSIIARAGNPPHNPKPSTERGKRRHANRNDEQKKHAEKAWTQDRSNRQHGIDN